MVKIFTPIYPSSAGNRDDKLYYQQLRKLIGEENGLDWDVVNKKGSKLSEIETRKHADLQEIAASDETDDNTDKNKHVSNADMKAAKDHRDSSTAHGANGDIIGNEDYATTTEYGVVKKMVNIADLNQTITNPPTQAEVQALSDKIDALLVELQDKGLME